jgi:tetratricopeptide (TPR) repeat protein
MKLIVIQALLAGLMNGALASAAIAAELRPVLKAQQAPTPTLPAKAWERPTLRLTLPTTATQVKFSQDGEHLLTTDATRQTAALWNLTTGQKQAIVTAKAGFAFCDVALSADGQFAAALLYAREASSVLTKRKIELNVWNPKTGQARWTSPIKDHVIQANQTTACQVEFSPNSQSLATSVSGLTFQSQPGVRLWSVVPGKLQAVTSSSVAAIGNLTFSRDSSTLGFSTLVDNQAQVHLWHLNGRRIQAILKAGEGKSPLGILAVQFTADQQDIIAYTNDGIFSKLYRWQAKTGKPKGISELGPDRTDRFLGLSPDSETYVYGGDVTGFHIGNLRSNGSLAFPQGLQPDSSVSKVVFSPDGQQMAIVKAQTIMILQSQPSTLPPVSDALTSQIAELAALAAAPDANKAEVIQSLKRWLVKRVDRRSDYNPEDWPVKLESLLRDLPTQPQPQQKAQLIKVLDQVTAQSERIRDPQQKIVLLSNLPRYYQQLGASDRTTTVLTRAIQLSLKQSNALDRAMNLGALLTTASQLQQTAKIAPFLSAIEAAIVPLMSPGQVGRDSLLRLAQAYADTQQPTQALRLLDRVAVFSPSRGGDPVLARLYLQLKRLDQATSYLKALVKQPELLVEDSSYALLAAATDKLKHPLAQPIFNQGWKFANRSLFYTQAAFVNDYLKAGGNPSRVRK